MKSTCWDTRATDSIIKSGQKDTEASIRHIISGPVLVISGITFAVVQPCLSEVGSQLLVHQFLFSVQQFFLTELSQDP